MAIDQASVELWNRIKNQLPDRPAVLEIGRANWFGDVDPSTVPEWISFRQDYLKELLKTGAGLYKLAELYYRNLLNPILVDSVDNGAPGATCWDLNQPLPLTRQYDIVINTGTAEHVFNQAQVFYNIHNACTVGGIMVHAFPVEGCPDHGFYNYQPNLLTTLAKVNGYSELAKLEREVRGDRILHLAWRKTSPRAFVIPQQGAITAGVMGGQFTPISAKEECRHGHAG